MLEYFGYKKIKKHKAEKKAAEDAKEEAKRQTEASKLSEHARAADRREKEVIRPDDESFLQELLASDDTPAPPLPPRLYSRELDWASDNEDHTSATTSQNTAAGSANGKGKEKATAAQSAEEEEEAKKQNRISALFTRYTAKKPDANDTAAGLKPESAAPVTRGEEEKEKRDLTRVLDRLNLSVKNNKVITTGSSDALVKFTNVFKDPVNGVPTAYDDLMGIIEDKDGALAKGFDKLPSSLKKLVTQLPDKITQSLGPELLAAAAASQGIKTDAGGGMKGAAKKAFLPHNLYQLVTKPGAIVSMLRAIVEVLKTRWPAFIGLNVMWGVALSLLLFVLWYCHKRGREVRLESERSVDGSDRIEELADDPALPAPEASSSGISTSREESEVRETVHASSRADRS